jgi:hypothetical protein
MSNFIKNKFSFKKNTTAVSKGQNVIDFFSNIDGTLKFLDLKQTNFRLFYDSTWTLVVENNFNLKTSMRLTLDDSLDNKYIKVIEMLISCKSIEDIKNLDQRNKIYYD